MVHFKPAEQNQELLRQRAAKARLSAADARTTQARQHLEGMASYWEELLREQLMDQSVAQAAS